ncbi:MAG: hypothetical protein ABFR75_11650 [Acidobacteriota bacterium]
MKKVILILILIYVMLTGVATLSAEKKTSGKNVRTYVEKTYFLKNVSARFVVDSLKVYIVNKSYNGNILSVTIRRDNVEKFEKLLKIIDVEKRKINFRIFAVIGKHDGTGEKIENKDLKKVLNELKEVLSFKSFKVDGVASLAVMEGARSSSIKLSSKSGLDLKLRLVNVSIKKEKSGKRSVHFHFNIFKLIESSTFVRENGYLVAGVSKIGKNGDSLILIINTEIE